MIATVSFVSKCSGGNHLTFSIARTGNATRNIKLNLDDLKSPVTEEEAEIFVKIITKLVADGKTSAQALAVLQAGVVLDL